MRVFVTGATGFIGSAIVAELLGAGHQVLGLARSDASAKSLTGMGADVHRGSLDDLESLKQGAAASDGVAHLAFVHDFADVPSYIAACETDLRAIQAIGETLANSHHPFVIAGGTACLSPGHLGTEDEAADPNALAGPRVPAENATLALAGQNVRASVVRLSPTVHGEGEQGFIPMLINLAREKGVSAYIGDGSNRWPAVHRLDAALLFRLALEKGSAGSRFHGVQEEGVPVRDIATVIGRRLGVPVVSKSPNEAAEHFGFLAHFVALDNPTSSALTQERLGWNPTHLSLLADLDHLYYFK